jgi:hypothetical protein
MPPIKQLGKQFPEVVGYLVEEHPTHTGETDIVCTDADTAYPWISATEGYVTGIGFVTSDLADANGDNLEIGVHGAGVYDIDLDASFSGTAGATFMVGVYKGGTLTNVWLERKIGTGGDVGNAGCSGRIALVAGDELSVEVISVGGASKTFTIHRMGLSITRVGQ